MLYEHIWKLRKICPNLCWCITRDGKVFIHWKGKKGRYNVYCNFMPERCAVQFTVSSSCYVNPFSSTSMATSSLDSTKTDANVICFLAVSGTSCNDQHYTSTNRSEQLGTCILSRILFSAPDKKDMFLTIYAIHSSEETTMMCSVPPMVVATAALLKSKIASKYPVGGTLSEYLRFLFTGSLFFFPLVFLVLKFWFLGRHLFKSLCFELLLQYKTENS